MVEARESAMERREKGEGYGAGSAAEEKQVQVKFSTKLPQEFRVPASVFALPVRLTRYGLSEVVNTLLARNDRPVPFDFLVNGALLRTSLEEFLGAHSISAESVVNVEYVKALLPHTLQNSINLNDWVTALAVSSDQRLFVGDYSGVLRLFTEAGKCNRTWSGHSDAITSICTLQTEQGGIGISGSKDKTIRTWELPSVDDEDSSNQSNESLQVLHGHTAAVQTIASSPSCQEFCSGSWDFSLRIWTKGEGVEAKDNTELNGSHKRRKADSAAEKDISAENLKFRESTMLQGHSQCVSTAVWTSPSTLISGSWDHSLRCWDVAQAVNTLTMTGSRPVLCLSVRGQSSTGTELAGGHVLVEGGTDNVLRLWDTRAASSAMKQLMSHKNWISAVRWSDKDEHSLLSASYDSTVKLWDIRSEVPVHTFREHTDKVMCIDWWNSSVVSGGADCKVCLYSQEEKF